MLSCVIVGLWVGLSHLVSIVSDPIIVSADCCRLSYQLSAPIGLLLPYLYAVAVPFLASSKKGLVMFGLGVTISCAAAFYMTTYAGFPSLWCFFAAILSAGLYLYFRTAARTTTGRLNTGATSGVVAA